MSSLETVKWALSQHGLDPSAVTARDLYSRGLDVQNLGGFAALERAVDEYGEPKHGARRPSLKFPKRPADASTRDGPPYMATSRRWAPTARAAVF
jgi:hypothetical protein